MINKFKLLLSKLFSILPQHIKEALSEDGVGSYSRYAGAFSIVIASFWITYLVIRTGHLPDLGGAATWVATGQSAYAANQAKKVASAIKGAPTRDAAAPVPPQDQQ
jgi:hypothetical protein